MNDLQRALANTLLDFILEHRLAGRKLTAVQRGDTTAIARELGLFPTPRRRYRGSNGFPDDTRGREARRG